MSVKAGTFQSGTGAVNSTFSVTGLGFQPKAILFFASNSADTSNAHASSTLQRQAGIVDSALNMYCVGNNDQDNVTTTNSHTRTRTDSVTCLISTANAITGQLAVSSLDADGFTMKVITQYGATHTIMYLALGGADLTNTLVGSFTAPATAIDKAISGLGFRPDSLLFLSGAASSAPSSGTSSRFSIGAATRPDSQNGCFAGVDQDNVGTSNAHGYLHMGDSLTQINASTGNMLDRGHVKSFDSDGFTTTWNIVNGGQLQYAYLALKGGSFSIRTAETTASSTAAITINNIGFKPRGGLVVNSDDPEDGAGNPGANDDGCFGIWDAVSSQFALEQVAYDNQATTNNRYAMYFDAIHVIQNNSGTIKQVTNLTAVGQNSITIQPSINTNIGNEFMWFLLVGDTNTGGQGDGAGDGSGSNKPSVSITGLTNGAGDGSGSLKPSVSVTGRGDGAGDGSGVNTPAMGIAGISDGAGDGYGENSPQTFFEGIGDGAGDGDAQMTPILPGTILGTAAGAGDGVGDMTPAYLLVGIGDGASDGYANMTPAFVGGDCCDCSKQGEAKMLYKTPNVKYFRVRN